MRKIVLVCSLFLASASVLHAQDHMRVNMEVISGDRPPSPDEARMMRAEEQGHPNIVQAMHKIEDAMNSLKMAPDSFGGHKAQAQEDLKRAYISLRKALYYRLYEDRH